MAGISFDLEDIMITDVIWSSDQTGNPCSCINISKDEELVIFSNIPGKLAVVHASTGSIMHIIEEDFAINQIASCKFYPCDPNLLLYACKDGFIFTYNIYDMKAVNMTRHLGTAVTTMAVDPFGETFTIACADGSLRIYDIETMQRVKALVKYSTQGSSTSSTSSQSSIYSLLYHPTDSNVLITSQVKDCLYIWDIRSGAIERTIFGPHIRGNGVDIHDNTILTASYRDSKQIELFDFGSGHRIKEVPISEFPYADNSRPVFFTTAKFAENGFDFCVGGPELNSAYLFDYKRCGMFGRTTQFKDYFTCCTLSAFGTMVITGSETGYVSCQLVRIKEK
ncbi:WD40 domain containing protein [Tritrichomonas foetus]|uniref:WD40 domain containing protein n=1 Tax=Tritrichomonas foetus TaxID=1144522 RepID=A0A1J4K6B2_9EUKA|nr:WD40 domain containing protein [Tritrichomonas foetus]|eukprot:OHT05244.1 WD40 domain containing protein [Tritrichomonas foetus]